MWTETAARLGLGVGIGVCLALGACGSESTPAAAAGASAPSIPTTPQPTTAAGRSAAGAAGSGNTASAGTAGRASSGQPATAGGTSTSTSAAGSGSVQPTAGSAAIGGSSSPETAGVAGATGTTAGTGAAGEPASVACDPKDETPAATVVSLDSISGSSNPAPIVPAKGPLMPVIEHDPGLSTHTVYRPMTFGDTKYPVVVWANGGCIKNGTMFARFLLEIASHGFVIVADGKPNGSGMGPLETNGVPQTQALDWIVAENERPCSKFYHKLDTTKIAAMGQSCGGLMTLGVSGDARLSTIVVWNSGMFERDQKIYSGLHTPVAYFIGGMDDVAYPQAQADFEAISTVPLFYGNYPAGHGGTYAQDNGGEFARVGIAWLKWQLYGDQTEAGGKQFVGADCGLCQASTMWTVRKKMLE